MDKARPLARQRIHRFVTRQTHTPIDGSGDRPPPPPSNPPPFRTHGHAGDYEEVGGPPHSILKKPSGHEERSEVLCALCGSLPAAVKCDQCTCQLFCTSCDLTYHRHPRRGTHIRKKITVKLMPHGSPERLRPPLPPKTGETPPVQPPQPPPRKHKRGLLQTPVLGKAQNSSSSGGSRGGLMEKMGNLKRLMGRPLPPPPPPGTSNMTGNTNFQQAGNNMQDSSDRLPQTVEELNHSLPARSNSAPRLQPQQQQHQQLPQLLKSRSQHNSLPRKYSLQQPPQNVTGGEERRSSMVEPTGLMRWDDQNAGQQQQQQPQQQPQQRAFAPNGRSQSISDDQWAQVMGTGPQRSQTVMNASMMQHQQRGGVPPLGGRSGAVTPGGGRSGLTGRGIVSSASVCDLNQMSQPQPPPQVSQHSFGAPMQNAGSFQQLNMMGYPQGNMMWAPPACDMCNVPAMYPPMAGPSMKRAASNLSMNMSSTSSEMGSCGWHHHHHHMPMYPGYHPGFQPQMVPPIGMHGSQMGLNVSIPDSMHAFSKVPSSSASSIRSSSHRIPKSSKTKSFSSADNDGRNRRHRRRSESEDSAASYSDSEEIEGMSDERLAWQCDHCTFINQPDTKTCGMCSKTGGDIDNGIGSNNRRRSGSDRRRGSRRNRNTDDGDGRDDDISVVRSNLSFHLRDEKKYSSSNLKSSSRNLPKQLSNRRLNKHKWSSDDQGRSSISASDEDTMLARQMKGLDVSKSRGSGTGHYEGVTTTARDKERLRRKKEGNFRRKY